MNVSIFPQRIEIFRHLDVHDNNNFIFYPLVRRICSLYRFRHILPILKAHYISNTQKLIVVQCSAGSNEIGNTVNDCFPLLSMV